jgi:glycosyltransferase involved in cell wall biosynthesis
MNPLPVPVVITAFEGDARALEQSLQLLSAQLPGVSIRILASDDAQIAAVARAAGIELLPLLPAHCPDDGYWCAVATALRSEAHPVLVLRCGTQLPAHWYARLQPARGQNELAALFPLGIRHPCTTVFQDTAHTPGLKIVELDTWICRLAPGRVYDLPVFSGWTAWLNPGLFPAGTCTSDTELALALIESGNLLLATDALAVDDSAFAAQQLPNLYPAWRDAMLQRHHLSGMRHAMTEISTRQENPPPDSPLSKPVRLHICHGWGGGLWRWVEDFVAADVDCFSLILRPVGELDGFGKTIVLHAADGSRLASWTLARPILSTALTHHEYQSLLQDILRDFAVSEVLVSSFIGHSLDVLRSGLPTTIICHDFYPLCPLVMATWQGPCTRCDDARMRDCLQHNPSRRFFDNEPLAYWQELRRQFLALAQQNVKHFVAPTPSAAQRWQALAPGLPASRFRVIGHGLPPVLLENLGRARKLPADGMQNSNLSRLKIVVLGNLEAHKGGELLLLALPALQEIADLVLLGVGEGGKAFEKCSDVTVLAEYRREELGELLAAHAPDLGLLLSTVPETFSYTLSELQAAGVPVAATALGAFADRIEQDRNGWLVETSSAALVALVQTLHQTPERITAVRSTLLAQAQRSTRDMVQDYNALDGMQPSRLSVVNPGTFPYPAPVVQVLPDASFRDALRGFARYTEGKIHGSPRIPPALKPLLLALLRLLA